MKANSIKPTRWKKGKSALQLSEYEKYRQTLTEAELGILEQFFSEIDSHVSLAYGEKDKIRIDFENALLHFDSIGVQLEDALTRLSIENLGGFYARPPILWYALDDAATIYPLSMRHGQMSVFRLSVYCKSPIVQELLQMALTFTIKRFPTFATTVKKGFFWHYLDATKRRYSIQPESDIPCKPLKVSLSGSQSFRVLYFRNSISVEFFHALTDGAGGMVFLKTLTAEYLRLLGAAPMVGGEDSGILKINESPSQSESANEFKNAEKTNSLSGYIDKPAAQMSGKLSKTRPCRVLHFKMDSTALKDAAKRRNATVTAYVLSLMFVAGKHSTDELSGNINIQVPVDMRKFFRSDTLRNFSMYCGIKLPLNEISDVGSIISGITLQLNEKTTKDKMCEMLGTTERMVSAVRYIPLFIKTPAARVVYGFLGDKIFSNTLSNLGVVTLPDDIAGHIDSMDFVLGGALTNRASCSMVTFGKTATLSISKCTADPSFEEKLYGLLISDGVTPVVEGSELHEG